MLLYHVVQYCARSLISCLQPFSVGMKLLFPMPVKDRALTVASTFSSHTQLESAFSLSSFVGVADLIRSGVTPTKSAICLRENADTSCVQLLSVLATDALVSAQSFDAILCQWCRLIIEDLWV